MEYPKECTCAIDEISIDFSTILPTDNEDLEEIDEDELIEDIPVSHNIIWQEICDNFNDNRSQIEEYNKSKLTECEVPFNPAVDFLDKQILPRLILIMEATINKAKELKCIKHQKSAFNGIDFIAEMFWNLNPQHPERQDNWTYIFDMEWAVEWLKAHPRPFYPFSWIWSRDYAATKIQAAMRGHWVRCRENVQEMRQFWKTLEREKQEALLQQIQSTEHTSKIKINEL